MHFKLTILRNGFYYQKWCFLSENCFPLNGCHAVSIDVIFVAHTPRAVRVFLFNRRTYMRAVKKDKAISYKNSKSGQKSVLFEIFPAPIWSHSMMIEKTL